MPFHIAQKLTIIFQLVHIQSSPLLYCSVVFPNASKNSHSFGCETWYYSPNTKPKLEPCARHGVFIAYLKNNFGYYVFDTLDCQLVKTTTAKFFESNFLGISLKTSPTCPVSEITRLPWPEPEQERHDQIILPAEEDSPAIPVLRPI